MFTTKERDINRKIVGKLIGPAWEKAATIKNATSGFLAAGIYPYNPDNIPDYFFQIHDNSQNVVNAEQTQLEQTEPQLEENELQIESFFSDDSNYIFILDDGVSGETNRANITEDNENSTKELNLQEEIEETEKLLDMTHSIEDGNIKKRPTSIEIAGTSKEVEFNTNNVENIKDTPSKYLDKIAPVPIISNQQSKRKQSAKILTTNDMKQKGKKQKLNSESSNKKKGKQPMKKTDNKNTDDSNTDDVNCCECLENYFYTREPVDWIQCIDCQQWLHETCTMYGDRCNSCGRVIKRKTNLEKVTKKLVE